MLTGWLSIHRKPHERVVIEDTLTGERILVDASKQRGEIRLHFHASKRFRILRGELVKSELVPVPAE